VLSSWCSPETITFWERCEMNLEISISGLDPYSLVVGEHSFSYLEIYQIESALYAEWNGFRLPEQLDYGDLRLADFEYYLGLHRCEIARQNSCQRKLSST
jgi:hypothetical protein